MFPRPATAPPPPLGAGFSWERLEPSGGAGCSSASKRAGSGPACAPSDGCQAPAQKPPGARAAARGRERGTAVCPAPALPKGHRSPPVSFPIHYSLFPIP